MIRYSLSSIRNCKSGLVGNCRSVSFVCASKTRSGIENQRRNMSKEVKNSPLGDKFGLPKRYGDFSPSVWNEYIQLAAEYKPLNLGQGFPDYHAPKHVLQSLADIAKSPNPLMNQYTRGYGHLRLVQSLAKFYGDLVGRQINAMTEVLVTVGAYEALYCAIQGHVDHGDEVIIIEPYFDCYDPMVRYAGGVPRFIPLKPKSTTEVISSEDWVYDEKELESLFNEKTKMIILNTPHNPLGKVFNRKELEKIAELCIKYNVLCLSDEVYEHMVFEPYQHIRICTLPGMWDRTITIGSAGKTFSVTGWKIGWAYGPNNLLTNLMTVHQNCVYTCSTPIQEAIALGFEHEMKQLDSPECYFKSISKELMPKRDYMAKFLKEAGMIPTIPQGGYFMVADWAALAKKVDLSKETDKYRDYKFTKYMTKNVGLQGIPPSAFYSSENKHLAEDFVRYCFFKTDKVLDQAADILKKWK